MSKTNYNAKQLKNITVLTQNDKSLSNSANSLIDQTLENVTITSGTINNTVIGNLFPNALVASTATLGNMTISGNTISTNNNSVITFNAPILYSLLVATGERLNMSNVFITPNNTFNVTMINTTTPNTALAGTLMTPTLDFFEKQIIIETLATNSTVQLNFPLGTLCSSEGCTSAQSILFTCPGQGVTLIYSLVQGCWYVKNAGASIMYL